VDGGRDVEEEREQQQRHPQTSVDPHLICCLCKHEVVAFFYFWRRIRLLHQPAADSGVALVAENFRTRIRHFGQRVTRV
jgi:hypothetical protein